MALVYVRSILAIVLCLAGALAYWFGYSAMLRGDVFGVPFEAIELAQAQALKVLNYARRSLAAYGKLRGNMRKPTTSFIRSTAGSTKASRQLILLRQKRCWSCRNQSAHSSRGRRSCGAQPNLMRKRNARLKTLPSTTP